MYLDPWLPLKYPLLPDLRTGPLLHGGESFQVIRTSGGASQALLVAPETAQGWADAGLVNRDQFDIVHFGMHSWAILTSDERHLVPLQSFFKPSSKSDALGFAAAFKRSRARLPHAPLASSIYVERLAVLLPVPELTTRLGDDVILGRFLTGGVEISCHARVRLAQLAPWISAEDLREICESAGIAIDQPPPEATASFTVPFSLPGRAQLQEFLREHVIEIVQHAERYRTLGVEFPSAIILHGPPGSGKTFAVDALVAYLKWPSFHIDSGSIGSPYIHATSQRIAEIFEQAMQHAPAVVVIDEMEAFLTDRHAGGPHRVEEVAEFLRRIPQAQSQRVLVIGMTNRIDTIDPAILRRGRFDHIVKVDLPTEAEITALLHSLLQARPCEDGISLASAVRHLTGKPMSEAAYLVREASRLAAKAGKTRLDDISLAQALRAISR